MCFHTKQTKKAKALEKRFKASVKDEEQLNLISSDYNGFDFPKTPIITKLEQDCIQLFNWGLIPDWSKGDTIKQYTLNARIETLDEKPSFKHHATHRCLVLADGFYEWQWLDTKGKRKQKFEIGIESNELFAFAGIWSEWTNTTTGELKNTYSIVTTEAQRVMREVHNSKMRMPVVLHPEQENEWLNGANTKSFIDTKVELIAKPIIYQQSLF